MKSERVTASVYIEAPPQRVYEFFTRPEAIVRWLGESAHLDPVADGAFEVDILGTRVLGRFLHLDPPRRLVISWGYAGSDRLPAGASTVEVRLADEGTGTRVELDHRDLPAPERPGHSTGWDHYLERLQTAVTGEAGPDPGMPVVATVHGSS